ncbi:uncharacterized protein LOC141533547 [Cotesia typhae]|uniref:uncharacterized protein LOC141533547 n=1 Tax=Cotesia typhae TaxID=2053667 RepID=UPI003D680A46
MIKLGLISINKNKRKRNEDNESVESENDGSTITLESLKDLDVPLNEFLVLWKATFDERRNLLQNYDFEIYNYLSEFFAFKDDRGYLLLKQDFDTLYPDRDQIATENWRKVEQFLYKN